MDAPCDTDQQKKCPVCVDDGGRDGASRATILGGTMAESACAEPGYPKAFDALAERIEASRERSTRLTELRGAMVESASFSDDEVAAVDVAIREAEAEGNNLSDELAQAMRIWKDDILTVQKRLRARASVVGRYEQELQLHETAMQCIARGQVQLQEQAVQSARAIGCADELLAFEASQNQSGDAVKSAPVVSGSDDRDPLPDASDQHVETLDSLPETTEQSAAERTP